MNTKTNTAKPARNEGSTEDLYQDTQPFTQTGFLRREDESDWDYRPEGDLEVTEELSDHFEEQGLRLRWVRHTKDEKLDGKNIARNKKKGYEFVKMEQIPSHLRERFEGAKTLDGFDGYVTYEDLVLMASPTWKYEIVKGRIEERALNNLQMVDQLLQKETGRAGIKNSEHLNLINDSKGSVVKVGGKREVSYAKGK